MNASCKEAKRPRKWLLSVIAAIIAVISCASIMAPQNTYADNDEYKNIKEECVKSGAAKSIGWIVCPVMVFLQDASQSAYEYIEDKLQVDTKLFTNTSDATYEAWGMFRNIANILFAVLFLIVIISQISGIGINNYGIKKLLPKLIVTAILVNVSYWICLILVDVSNIVGASVLQLLTSLGGELPDGIAAAGGGVGAQIGSTVVTAVPISIALITGVTAVILNPAIILSMLVGVIGLFISLFTLFILLAAREAIVVVLVVVSPIAIVCYMLPNTKKVYDRFIRIAEGMLYLYPICGLLIGGGNFVSRLMLTGWSDHTENIGDFFTAFTAMLISIVPIFFIPSVVKKAFVAVDNLGEKISSAGRKFRGGVEGRIRNDAHYRDMQRRGMEHQARITAGIGKDGKAKDRGAIGTFLMGGKRNIADARAQFLKNQSAQNRANSYNDGKGSPGFEAAQINQDKAFQKEELGEWITLINEKTRNGEDEKALFALYDEAVKNKNKNQAVAVARIAGRRKDTAARFLGEKITGATLKPLSEDSSDENKAKHAQLAANNAIFNNPNDEGEGRRILQSVAKEIATGDNSGSYRESSPLGFEFAAAHNRDAAHYDKTGHRTDDSAPEAIDYGSWSTTGNLSRATNNYITNSRELVGAKNSSLQEIVQRMNDGTISEEERSRLQHLAQMTIDNKDKTGVWDTTKEEAIYAIAASGYGPPRPPAGGTGGHTPTLEGDGGPIGGGAPTGGGAA